MRIEFQCLVALFCLSAGAAGADELKPPPTREGLWETRSTHTEDGKTVSSGPVKMCQSHETTKSMQERGEAVRKENQCTSHVTRPAPNTYVEESRCAKGPNAGSVTKVVYTHQGDTSSHTEMHVNAGGSDSLIVIDAKYLGVCPAGMKPGDLMMSDGKIVSGGN